METDLKEVTLPPCDITRGQYFHIVAKPEGVRTNLHGFYVRSDC